MLGIARAGGVGCGAVSWGAVRSDVERGWVGVWGVCVFIPYIRKYKVKSRVSLEKKPDAPGCIRAKQHRRASLARVFQRCVVPGTE